jgi:ATP-binding cassette subfamily B protein RaxB
MTGEFSVGMLMAFMSYKMQFATRVSSLIDRLYEIKMLQLQGERLADVVLTPPEETPEAPRIVLSDMESTAPDIEVQNLRFRYAPNEPFVLNGVNLGIRAGESVAIVGPSGCGKSTLMNVMLGLHAPTEGEVRIAGISIGQLGHETVRGMVGAVTQDDTLFAGSIADNISFFDPKADQEWIERCASAASIHADVAAMPMGYNTFVGDMGSVLSGGQKQRVLLARALYKRPKILFLDEATSSLDLPTELAVNSAIRERKVTRVIIAHRPHTIESADRVVCLENGRTAPAMARIGAGFHHASFRRTSSGVRPPPPSRWKARLAPMARASPSGTGLRTSRAGSATVPPRTSPAIATTAMRRTCTCSAR